MKQLLAYKYFTYPMPQTINITKKYPTQKGINFLNHYLTQQQDSPSTSQNFFHTTI